MRAQGFRVHDRAEPDVVEPEVLESTRLPLARQQASIEELTELVLAFRNVSERDRRIRGTRELLGHLERFPADTWSERWGLFEASLDKGTLWTQAIAPDGTTDRWQRLVAPLIAMIAHDVIRPSYGWMQGCKARFTDIAEWRDPDSVAILRAELDKLDPGVRIKKVAVRTLAQVQAHTGKTIRQLEAADIIEMRDSVPKVYAAGGLPLIWRALRSLGWITHPSLALPPRRRGIQLSAQELVDYYGLDGRFGEVIVEYLKHRSAGLDYPTRKVLARTLVKHYWMDMLSHHPDLQNFQVTREQIDAWKKRVTVKPDGTPRREGFTIMTTVRAFYHDISQWALHDSYWVEWVAPSPIYASDLKGYRKSRKHVIAEKQNRTREIAPYLPKLVETAENARRLAAENLAAAQTVGDGGRVIIDGLDWEVRQIHPHSPFRIRYAGEERNLTELESNAFWAWAIIEVLRQTGIRHEEMLELTHLAIQPYKIPSTGETVPLLHVAPSKTDEERLLVASPELVHVLHQILTRVRTPGSQAVPITQRWDPHEKTLGEPMPHIFIKQHHTDSRVISQATVLSHIQRTATAAGVMVNGKPAHITPIDLRRIFATEALASGLPPHIVQVLMGHKSIATTQGYAAIYPADVIRHHRTFIAQRRRYRPSEEYREPTQAEWEEFQAHFVTRKVSLGSCGRAYGTGCHHEHACVRCSLLRPDPNQIERLREIVANLHDRITEAREQGWLGEVEGLEVTLGSAQQKLLQMKRLQTHPTSVTALGMPDVRRRG